MGFQEEYELFLLKHKQERTGESLRRLEEGHGYAERLFLETVWWPAVGNFLQLYPEYQVSDFKDGFRYLDFAWIRPPYRICIEIDGYGPHLRDISRWQHGDQLRRQNDLILDDWIVIRFSLDEIKERPHGCRKLIQQMIGKWYGNNLPRILLTDDEKKIIQLCISQGLTTPLSVAQELKISDRTARNRLKELVNKGILQPAADKQRIHAYRLDSRTPLDKYWYLT